MNTSYLIEKNMKRRELFNELKVQNNLEDDIAKRLYDEIMRGNTFHYY